MGAPSATLASIRTAGIRWSASTGMMPTPTSSGCQKRRESSIACLASRSGSTWRAPGPQLRSGGAPRSRPTRPTTTAPPFLVAVGGVNIGRKPFQPTCSRQTPGAFIRCTAMHSNGSRTAWNETYQSAPSDGSIRMAGNWPGRTASDVAAGGCSRRVRRGGAWNYPPKILRAAYRNSRPGPTRASNLGMRVARTLGQ